MIGLIGSDTRLRSRQFVRYCVKLVGNLCVTVPSVRYTSSAITGCALFSHGLRRPARAERRRLC